MGFAGAGVAAALAAGCVAAGGIVAGCGSTAAPIVEQTTTQQQTASTTSASGIGVTTTPAGPENVPLEHGPQVAPASTTAQGQNVNDIQCSSLEQLAYQAHVHLQIFVHGRARSLPGGIGMVEPKTSTTDDGGVLYSAFVCYYWIHTYAADGVIHVDAPVPTTFTLGDFFDVWGQRLSSREVAGHKGHVTAIVNGRLWRRDPRAIPLRNHAVIELDVGAPVRRFERFSWTGTNL